MNWYLSHQADPRARCLADRHYSRKKPGTKQFTPPGRTLVLLNAEATAVWVTSWPFVEYVNRDYKDAWLCSLFRNESGETSSDLICEAVSVTRWKYGDPPYSGMITMIDPGKVHSTIIGYCYRRAKFKHVGETKGGLLIFQLTPTKMPVAQPPAGLLWETLS